MTTDNEIAWPTNSLAPVRFVVPPLNPAGPGLFSVVNWTESNEPLRWLESGVQLRQVGNFTDDLASGTWSEPWCEPPGSDEHQLKWGVRPDPNTTPFTATTIWSDDQAEPSALGIAETRQRCQQILRMAEQPLVEREVASRMLSDAGTPSSATDLIDAVGQIEQAFAAARSDVTAPAL
jgi:hypothetical protein